MFGLMGFGTFGMSEKDKEFYEKTMAKSKARRKAHLEKRMIEAVPWDSKMKFQKEINIKASTFTSHSLFDVEPLLGPNVNKAEPKHLDISPSGQFCYCEKILEKGRTLLTMSGSRKGDVVFDGPILIPSLHEKIKDPWDSERIWKAAPWMSITPFEIFTLRAGTKKAKGDVVLAGLGLGYQLIEVSKKRNVKSLRIIEQSQELVDWLMPKIKPLLGMPVEVIVGDAEEELLKMKADVALVDIYRNYGNKGYYRDRLNRDCAQIDDVWVWGSASIG